MKTPLFVAISDIHFNLENLDVATNVLCQAFEEAKSLNTPLIIAGDLHDTKSLIRGECSNRLIALFSNYHMSVASYTLIGNHCRLNEKHPEHALNFLRPYTSLVPFPTTISINGQRVFLCPYQSDPCVFKREMREFCNYTIDIAVIHQGVHGALMGQYVIDKSSVPLSTLEGYKTVISGHYHEHQVLGNLTYIGSPYTISFGEAQDPEKGFLVVHTDGTYYRVLTNQRKHCIYNISVNEINDLSNDSAESLISSNADDKIWIKLHGTQGELATVTKEHLDRLLGRSDYRFDKYPTNQVTPIQAPPQLKEPKELLDKIIEDSGESKEHIQALRSLWREVYEAT